LLICSNTGRPLSGVRLGWSDGCVSWLAPVLGRKGRAALYSRRLDDIVNANYEKLAGLLRDRQGWRPEVRDGERYWCFGGDGEARLVVTAEMDGFLMYRADQDVSWVIPRVELVGAWLDEHEGEHAGLSPLGEEFKKAYETALEETERGASGG
jgi:hypothetical protein